MLLKKKELNKELKNFTINHLGNSCTNYMYFQKSNYKSLGSRDFPIKSATSDINFDSSIIPANQFAREGSDYARGMELLDVLQRVVLLERKYLSYKDTMCTEYIVTERIERGISALDREVFSDKSILIHILKNSKVLNLKVSDMDFLIDMAKTVTILELKYFTAGIPIRLSYPIEELEKVILRTYLRLKSVIGLKKIREELTFSLSLLYSPDKAKLLVDHFGTNDLFDAAGDYLPCNKHGDRIPNDPDKVDDKIELIRQNMKNPIDAPEYWVTAESTTFRFSRIYKNASYLFDSIDPVNKEIRDLKTNLRKNGVNTLSIQKAHARALRILLLENPKQVKPKKARTRKSKKTEESTQIEETEDSEYEYEDEYEDEYEYDYEDEHKKDSE